MFKVVIKPKKLKKELKILNREQFSNIELQAEVAKKKLLAIQESIHSDPNNAEQHNNEELARIAI